MELEVLPRLRVRQSGTSDDNQQARFVDHDYECAHNEYDNDFDDFDDGCADNDFDDGCADNHDNNDYSPSDDGQGRSIGAHRSVARRRVRLRDHGRQHGCSDGTRCLAVRHAPRDGNVCVERANRYTELTGARGRTYGQPS